VFHRNKSAGSQKVLHTFAVETTTITNVCSSYNSSFE